MSDHDDADPIAVELRRRIDPVALRRTRRDMYHRHRAIRVAQDGDAPVVALPSVPTPVVKAEIDDAYHADVRTIVAPRPAIERLWQRLRQTEEEALAAWMRAGPGWCQAGPGPDDEAVPSARFVDRLIAEAFRAGFEQVLLVPGREELQIRVRKSGVVRRLVALPVQARETVVERVKTMSCLDLGTIDLPQDGRIRMDVGDGPGSPADLRVNVIPTTWGERVGLILWRSRTYLSTLDSLDMEPRSVEILRRSVAVRGRIIVIAGVTRSGRSRTLHAALLSLDPAARDVLVAQEKSLADLPGVTQAICRPDRGLSAPALLHAFLRSEPDHVAATIRHYETAELMVQAARGGVGAIALMDAPSAAEAVFRLADMGLEPRELADAFELFHAQRLLPRPCLACRTLRPLRQDERCQIMLDDDLLGSLPGLPRNGDPVQVAEIHGCEHCSHVGFDGFSLVTDQILLTEPVREALAACRTAREVRALGLRSGSPTFRETGATHLVSGGITLEDYRALLGGPAMAGSTP